MQVTGHWYSLTRSMSFPFLGTFSNKGMCSLTVTPRGDNRTLDKPDQKQMDGWISHHEDFEFVLQGQVTETIHSGKAFHCLESKFYLKRSYG